MQFIDEAAITLEAGNGGDGIIAWRREKYVPKGGPAGGDGGRGGDVFLEATPNVGTLVDFRFKKVFRAESGNAGSQNNKSGKAGDDLVIPVPVGTLVYRAPIDAEGTVGTERLFADMSEPMQRTLVAKGGRGGLGNQHYATSARQAPHFAEKGDKGERCTLRLELKLLADAGLDRTAQRRQVDAALGRFGRAAEDRRLPVHHARTATRRRAHRRGVVVRAGRRAGADRGRERRRRPRRPLPAARRAHARADPPDGRREAARRTARRQGDDRNRTRGVESGAAAEADDAGRHQTRSARTRATPSTSCARSFPMCAGFRRRPTRACAS